MNTGSESISILPNDNVTPECDKRVATVVVDTSPNCCVTTTDSSTTPPSDLRHNDLLGLQGGTPTERYHLTRAQYDAINQSGFILISGEDFEVDGITYNNVRLRNVKYTVEYMGRTDGGGSWDRGLLIPDSEYTNISNGGFTLVTPYSVVPTDKFQISYLTTIAGSSPLSLQDVLIVGNTATDKNILVKDTGNTRSVDITDFGIDYGFNGLVGKSSSSGMFTQDLNTGEGATFDKLGLTIVKEGTDSIGHNFNLRFPTMGVVNYTQTFQAKNGIVATLTDIPGVPSLQQVMAVGNTSNTPLLVTGNSVLTGEINLISGSIVSNNFSFVTVRSTDVLLESFSTANKGSVLQFTEEGTWSIEGRTSATQERSIKSTDIDMFVVTDTLANKGLEYSGDYELNFTGRSLVTKQYVDSHTATPTLQQVTAAGAITTVPITVTGGVFPSVQTTASAINASAYFRASGYDTATGNGGNATINGIGKDANLALTPIAGGGSARLMVLTTGLSLKFVIGNTSPVTSHEMFPDGRMQGGTAINGNEFVTRDGGDLRWGKVADTVTSPPATSSSTGTKGTIIVFGGFRYECIATNSWVRVAVSTF